MNSKIADYLDMPMTKNFKRKKSFLLGDFNNVVDLLKYDKHVGANELLDSLSCHMVLCCISCI